MANIPQFEVERWMDKYETTPGVLNIAETCASSISIDTLRSLSTDKSISPLDTSGPLTYGAIRGSEELRGRVAELHGGEGVAAEDVMVTQGAIAANFLVFYALLGRGDHVVCVYPTYQQLYDAPRSLGVEVSLWRLRKERGFVPDVSELSGLVKENTKMIIINNPNNPTGARIPAFLLKDIAAFARERDIILLSDEVYRPLYHDLKEDGANIPPPATSLGYRKTITTGSMSKAYALAGIRVGWVICADKAIMKAIAGARDYTTISVSQIDDQIARYALSEHVRSNLLKRNIELARTNVAILEAFVKRWDPVCSWVRPDAGTTAFVRFNRAGGEAVDDAEFCVRVLEETSAFFVPGSKCFGDGRDFKGYVRIGYVCETSVLVKALEKLGGYLQEHLC